MNHIKQRRLLQRLTSYPNLHVGDCVPFYFCPRSVMLYIIHRKDYEELTYRGGQEAIIHLEADLNHTIEWANEQGRRWVFTLSNAGAHYFEDRTSLTHLNDVDWAAVYSNDWANQKTKEGKQAEFLIERSFSWQLIERIGVYSDEIHERVTNACAGINQRPMIETLRRWYY